MTEPRMTFVVFEIEMSSTSPKFDDEDLDAVAHGMMKAACVCWRNGRRASATYCAPNKAQARKLYGALRKRWPGLTEKLREYPCENAYCEPGGEGFAVVISSCGPF